MIDSKKTNQNGLSFFYSKLLNNRLFFYAVMVKRLTNKQNVGRIYKFNQSFFGNILVEFTASTPTQT